MCGSMVEQFEWTELPDDFRLWNSDCGESSIVNAIFGVFGNILQGAGDSTGNENVLSKYSEIKDNTTLCVPLLNVGNGPSWSW